MPDTRDDEETTIFAIYSTRRDAEMARDYLNDEGIQAFVTADDAGGMHPQLQRPHGVKVVGFKSAAQDGYEVLREADLLPPEDDIPTEEEMAAAEERGEGLTFSLEGTAGYLGLAALILLLVVAIFGLAVIF